ncbi:NAD-dependent epimerase/dehydratase family protein [Bdellovibrio sp. BCCA]|uniref:NAD-dependent epimerase/dehydratase family protein n=1 Tax=Bdellovibrio sp. BCCA TaxID=3136281 RepID=UPI0030F1D355
MKVFVTGATGGIGPFVVQELLKQNFQVACLARDPSKLKQNVTAIQGDLLDIPKIEEAFANFKPDTIVHLGWIGVDKTAKGNDSQIVNLQAAVDLLKLAQKCSVKNFIGMGSEAEYGVHNKKIDESAKTLPLTKYAIAKLATGLLCEKICKDHGINFAWLRLFSSYGPGDRPGSLMSILIQTLLKKEPMKLSECIQVWDYVHARDIGRLIAMMAPEVKESGFYNLGGGQAQPIKNVVLKIASLIDPAAELQFGAIPYGVNQNMHLEADISKLKRVYGWEPVVGLDEGLKETVRHFFK